MGLIMRKTAVGLAIVGVFGLYLRSSPMPGVGVSDADASRIRGAQAATCSLQQKGTDTTSVCGGSHLICTTETGTGKGSSENPKSVENGTALQGLPNSFKCACGSDTAQRYGVCSEQSVSPL